VYNSIKLTDNKIGELLARLEKDNLKDSTIIFFFADHGEGMPRGKTNGINFGYRVPFVIWFPEMYKELSPWGSGGVVTSEMIDFADLAPTLISLAGGEIPEYMSGRAYLGNKREEPVENLHLSSDRSDNGIDMVRSVTDGKYMYSRNFMPFIPEVRYIRYMEIGEIKQQMRKDLADGKLNTLQKSLFDPRPAEFLYDIENDVWETRNLVGEEAFQPVLEKMRNLMKDEVLLSRDVMFLPEYEIGLLSDTTTAFEFAKNISAYPLDSILEIAGLSGVRGPEVTEKQISYLDNPNPVIRYWAALGLRSQGREVLLPHKDKILQSMSDPYPPVAVLASSTACAVFGDTQAKEKMKEFCLDENQDIALLAVYHLLYLDNRSEFVETVKKSREMEGRNYNVKAACMDVLGSLGLVPNNPDNRE